MFHQPHARGLNPCHFVMDLFFKNKKHFKTAPFSFGLLLNRAHHLAVIKNKWTFTSF